MSGLNFPIDSTVPAHPGRYILKILMPNFGVTAEDIVSSSQLSQNIVEGIINGSRDIDKNIVRNLRSTFGEVAYDLLRIQFIFDFYRDKKRRPEDKELYRIKSEVSKIRNQL